MTHLCPRDNRLTNDATCRSSCSFYKGYQNNEVVCGFEVKPLTPEQKLEMLDAIVKEVVRLKHVVLQQDNITDISWSRNKEVVFFEMGTPSGEPVPRPTGKQTFTIKINGGYES